MAIRADEISERINRSQIEKVNNKLSWLKHHTSIIKPLAKTASMSESDYQSDVRWLISELESVRDLATETINKAKEQLNN